MQVHLRLYFYITQQSPIVKISQKKNRIEISDTTAENTPKETITEPKNAVRGSYNNKKEKRLAILCSLSVQMT